ncbi:MAG: hypothetical protein J6X11_09165 [Treponema sp.]|nr:hypothetical protein [Treponema sp.]
MRKYILFLCLGLFVLTSCQKEYKFWKDKKIVPDEKLIENEWKYTLTIYYNNPDSYVDIPYEIGQIRDGCYEKKVEQKFYERSFYEFFSKIFTESPKIIKDKSTQEIYKSQIKTVCDLYNRNGKLIFWYSYDGCNEKDEVMLLNGKLIKKNILLQAWTKSILDSTVIAE